ncbi:hypothetical protein RL74_12610 [Pseudomonas fluorescens]|uniref:Uncharacterized protein n=1 Tax=Pseudomonas fluorescens TaxID=294 RepID=A0A0D0PJY5_PSEFL|nr:hypothetical protein RL74_12610 [Pseudomonas fluorescens]
MEMVSKHLAYLLASILITMVISFPKRQAGWLQMTGYWFSTETETVRLMPAASCLVITRWEQTEIRLQMVFYH